MIGNQTKYHGIKKNEPKKLQILNIHRDSGMCIEYPGAGDKRHLCSQLK